MASLDDTFDALKQFARALAEFNEALRLSALELAARHDALKGLWDDSAARSYALLYEPLETATQQYLASDAPRLSEFVEMKVRLLAEFLDGG